MLRHGEEMKISISGLLTAIDRRGALGREEICEATFKAARCHHRWVTVKVELTPHQADALVQLVSANQVYEYFFYDAVMEVWDHTGESPKCRLKTFEDQSGRVVQ
jgi:hypothetical protein